jgi:2-polyprenyl-6-methoxyphenol hydroxylase-like FAD-dependent oxidoreductase
MVRRAAAIDFVGHPARHTMLLGDVVLDAPPPSPMVTIVNEEGGLLVAPLGDGLHHRLALMDAAAASVAPPDRFAARRLASRDADVGRAERIGRDARRVDETRLAEHYRNGRLLLAGDAAHIHAPMGGQGMNVGIQDAMNLGWKLASVVHGSAPEELLDTYERARWPVGEVLRQHADPARALLHLRSLDARDAANVRRGPAGACDQPPFCGRGFGFGTYQSRCSAGREDTVKA